MTVPSVDDVLADTAIGCGCHQWFLDDGNMVEIHSSILKPALEAAYDESDPDWTLFVHIENA
jgi:hypothetical protein